MLVSANVIEFQERGRESCKRASDAPLYPCLLYTSFRLQLLRCCQNLLQSQLDVSLSTDHNGVVAADFLRIDIDLHELGHTLVEGYTLVPGRAVSLCHTASQDQDAVSSSGLLVSQLKAPETGLAQHQRMAVRDTALALSLIHI